MLRKSLIATEYVQKPTIAGLAKRLEQSLYKFGKRSYSIEPYYNKI